MANPLTFPRSRRNGSTGSTWLDDTIKLIKRAPGRGISYLEIHRATGVLPNWLSYVANGKIPDPSIRRIQAVHDFLLERMRHK